VDRDLACLGSASEILGPTHLYDQVLRHSTKSSSLKSLCTLPTIHNTTGVYVTYSLVLSLVCILSQILTHCLFW